MLSSKRQSVHVPRTTIRTDVGTLDIHASGKTGKTVVFNVLCHTIPIPRRLAKPVHVIWSSKTVDKLTSQAMPRALSTGESREVRVGADASNRVPGRKDESGTRACIPDGGAPTRNHTSIDRRMTHRGLYFSKAESLLGLMSANAPTIPLGRYMIPFQWEVIAQLRKGRDYGAWVSIMGQSARGLRWSTDPPHWLEGVPFQVRIHHK